MTDRLSEKLNLKVWIARLRQAGLVAGGVGLGAVIVWLGFNLLPLMLNQAPSDRSAAAVYIGEDSRQELQQELRDDLYKDFSERFAQLQADSEQESLRLAQEIRDEVKVLIDQAREEFDSGELDSEELDFLSGRVKALERDLAARPQPDANASAEDLAALKENLAKQVAALDRRIAEPSGSEFALLGLALSALKRAALSGRAFEAERRALKALLPRAKILDEMKKVSRTGVAPRIKLTRDFVQLAARARARGGVAGSVWDRVWQFVFRIIRVRRVGEMEGTSAAAILSRMEARVAQSDFSAVLEEARQLASSAEPRASLIYEMLRPWLAQVRARRALDGALVRLDIRVHQLLSSVIRKEKNKATR